MRKSISILVWLLIGSSVSAGSDVDGFRDIKFGTHFEDLVSEIELTLAPRDLAPPHDIGDWYISPAKMKVIQDEYVPLFYFNENILEKIRLSRHLPLSDHECSTEFAKVYSAVKSAYGESDKPYGRIDVGGLGTLVLTSARFTAKNGAYVNIAAFLTSSGCSILVLYGARGSNDGF